MGFARSFLQAGDDVYAAGDVGVHRVVLRAFDRNGYVGHHESHDRGHAGKVQGRQLRRRASSDARKSEGERVRRVRSPLPFSSPGTVEHVPLQHTKYTVAVVIVVAFANHCVLRNSFRLPA